MHFSEIESYIIKYLSNSATEEELTHLNEWILIDDNQKIFEEYVQLHLNMITSVNEPDTEKITQELVRKIRASKSKSRFKIVMKYAAIGLVLLITGYFYQQITSENENNKQQLVTIEFDNGTIQPLHLNNNTELKDSEGNSVGVQNGSIVRYTKNTDANELVYNTLNVPYGKKFELVLADGSHVFLNSGSSLRYPAAFVNGKERTVFLEGEAFFDVAKDKEHSFVVNASEINIEVLGTKFNVSHYPEDEYINTVLIEGAVQLKPTKLALTDVEPTLLKPGFKAEWNKETENISIETVNTTIYTQWTKGKLVFRNTPFIEIRKILERHYNVRIINKNSVLDKERFDATFDEETIEQVFELLGKSYEINYTRTGDVITINKN